MKNSKIGWETFHAGSNNIQKWPILLYLKYFYWIIPRWSFSVRHSSKRLIDMTTLAPFSLARATSWSRKKIFQALMSNRSIYLLLVKLTNAKHQSATHRVSSNSYFLYFSAFSEEWKMKINKSLLQGFDYFKSFFMIVHAFVRLSLINLLLKLTKQVNRLDWYKDPP